MGLGAGGGWDLKQSVKGHKEKQRSITRLACTIQQLTNTLKMFGGSATEKNPITTTFIALRSDQGKEDDRPRYYQIFNSWEAKWSALHKTFIKNECHSMNNLHVLCKIFIKDECHSMNSLHAA